MKYEINIPEYLTVGDYQRISMLEHLTENEKAVEMTSIVTNIERSVINKWSPNDVSKIVSSVLSLMQIEEATFYPIVELDGVLYGYRPLSKMTLGEYIDLERLCKDTVGNLTEIMAILYRPITKNKLKGIKYGVKHGFKIANGKAENLFKYYDIEEYDSEERVSNSELMESFPASFALGALSFFLAIGNQSLNSMNNSLTVEMKERMTRKNQTLIQDIGDGLLQFIRYQSLPSLTSRETKAYSN